MNKLNYDWYYKCSYFSDTYKVWQKHRWYTHECVSIDQSNLEKKIVDIVRDQTYDCDWDQFYYNRAYKNGMDATIYSIIGARLFPYYAWVVYYDN